MKISRILVMALVLCMLAAGVAFGATDTKTLTINATVNARAKLTLDIAAITFADADPDLTPSIPSSPATVGITASIRTGAASTATLTTKTATDLVSGSDTILISNVTWTASGSGFVAGTMNKTTEQSVGSWTGSGNRTGTITPVLANSWSYPPGAYAATATFTLAAP